MPRRVRDRMGALLRIAAMLAGIALGRSSPAQWSVEQFNSDNGLPQNSVGTIVLDQEGFAWITTEGGLVRFDGHVPQRIPLMETAGPPTRLREILAMPGGAFLVRDTRSRLLLIWKGHVTPYGPQDIDIDGYPYCRGEVPGPIAHAYATRAHWQGPPLLMWAAENSTVITLSSNEWLATDPFGLRHLRDSTIIAHMPFRSAYDRFFALDGDIFCLSEDNTLSRVDLSSYTYRPISLVGFSADPSLPPENILDVVWRSNDHVTCLRGGDDLYVLHRNTAGDTLRAEPLHLKLPTATAITSLHVDLKRGVVLVGTSTQGLYVYRRAPMRTLRSPYVDDSRNNNFYAQLPIGDDRVCVAGGQAANVFDANGYTTEPVPVDSFSFPAVLRDRLGRIWYPRKATLVRQDPRTGQQTVIAIPDNGPLHAHAFLEEGDTLWVGADEGVGYVVGDRLTRTISFKDETDSRTPLALARDPQGVLWMANCQGAYRLRDQYTRLEPVRGSEGLCVRTLKPLGDRMFLGTYGTGPWVFENDSLRRLPSDRKGYLDHVHSFMPDERGFLWLSTNRGMFRVHQREIDEYLNGTDPVIYYAYYGRNAGIYNSEFNGGCDPPYVRLRNGYASFPTLDGLVWFEPEEVPDPFPQGRILVDSVLVNGRLVMDRSNISLDPGNHELRIWFTVPYWGEATNVQFAYRIPGVQDDWYPLASDQRELRLRNLPHGEHTLMLRKLGGPPDDLSDQFILPFTVRKHFYEAGWFFVLCGVALALTYIAALFIYRARLRYRSLMLTRLVRVHTAELRAVNQRLERSVAVKERLVSIISHDIVTPLRFIARVANRAEAAANEVPEEELTGTLQDIALSSDKLYMNARNLLNWVKHQEGQIELRRMNVAVAALVDDTLGPVRELASTKGTELLNLVPRDLAFHTDRDMLGIILQNLVNNALNHGEGGRVVVSGEDRAGTHRLTVADDGPGLPTRTVNAIRMLQHGSGMERTSDPGVLGLGYVIITELLQLLGGELIIGDNAGRGTRITVMLPMHAPDLQPVEAAPALSA